MRLAFVTGGTIGAGHLVHGLAVERGLLRAGFRGTYAMFGPSLPFPSACRASYRAVEIRDDAALRDPRRAPESALARALVGYAPDLLLVDMFWAPLRFVLPLLRCEAWLLVRICPRLWLEGQPGIPFEPAQYARVLAMEPIRHPAVTGHVDPIVVANPDECRPPGALHMHFSIPTGKPLTVVSHAGQPGEVEQLKSVAGRPPTLVFDLFAPDALFPLAEWLTSADHVVCGAGYNSFWEAAWLGHRTRTTFVPFARSIDDQALRIAAFSGHSPRANGADTLARLVLRGA